VPVPTTVCRLRGTPLDVQPGTYSIPLSVSGQGAAGVGSLSGAVTVQVCVQPSSAYTPPYFVAAVDPVAVARYGASVGIGVKAWLRPGTNATVVSVTGQEGGPLPSWLRYNASAGEVQGRPAGDTTSGDFLVEVRFAVNGTAADLLTVVVRVAAAQVCSPAVVPGRGVWGGGVPADRAAVVLGGMDGSTYVAVAANGDVVVAGSVSSFGAGVNDVLVVRLDGRSGSVVWARVWGGIHSDWSRAVVIAPNGDVLVAGGTVSFSGSYDVCVLRLAGASGAVVWARTWYAVSSASLTEEAYSLTLTSNGDVVVVGTTNGAASGAGGFDALVMRLAGGTGARLWMRIWGGPSEDRASQVAMAANGDVMVAGYTRSFGGGQRDVFVLRLDSVSGAVLWARTWGGATDEAPNSMALAANGDVLVGGFVSSLGGANAGYDALVLRLAGGSGDVVWARTWSGSDFDNAVKVEAAPNGDVLVGGYTASFGAGGQDVLLLRLNGDNGDVVWARTWGGPQNDYIAGFALTAYGNVVVGGVSASFGPAPDVFVMEVQVNGTAPIFPELSFPAPARAGLTPTAVMTSVAGTVGSPAATTSLLTVDTIAQSVAGTNATGLLAAVKHLVPATVRALSLGAPLLQVGKPLGGNRVSSRWYCGFLCAVFVVELLRGTTIPWIDRCICQFHVHVGACWRAG
jgi:hypothetical protein